MRQSRRRTVRRTADQITTIGELRRRMAEFVRRREWEKYHRPKNLAMSLAVEAAELMEHFQWLDHEEADKLLADPVAREQIGDELADILAFLLSLANSAGIDLAASFARKMARNRRKYPVRKVRGRYQRPGRGRRPS